MRRDAGVLQDLRALGRGADGEREQDALDGDEAVARLLGDLLGFVEHARGVAREARLAGARAADLRTAWRARASVSRSARLASPPARLIRPGREAFLVVEDDFEQVLRRDLGVAFANGQALRRSG